MPKVSKPMTDYAVKTLKPSLGQTGPKEISDGGCRGLLLRLTPRGEKLWAVRVMVNGKRTFYPLGSYPAVSLAEARKRTGEYLASAKDGVSPAELDARAEAEKMTVADAHARYLDAMRGALRPQTVALKEMMFTTHVKPVAGGRMLRGIRKADIIEVVAGVTAKGFAVQANRVFSEVMALLRWCEHKGWVDGVPSIRKKDMVKVAGAAKESARRRTLTEGELTAAWKATANLGELSGDYLRLLMLTGQRRDEVRLMEWSEVNLESGVWTIPKARYKTAIDHAVPLPPQALAVLKARWREGATGYVLPGTKEGQPFNGALSALRRLRTAVGGKGDFTLHDLRRTLRTGLARLGVDETTAELVIGHLPQGIVKIYDTYDRLDERRDALTRWADYLDRLEAGGKVVTLALRGVTA